jgi:peroxiredoxin
MKTTRIFTSILTAALCCMTLLLVNCTLAESSNLEGKQAPGWELEDASGSKVKLSDFEGKIVLLDFWATWCPPCVQEIPGFIKLHEKYKDKGVAVVGVSLDQGGWQAVKPFIEKHKVTYPIVLGNMEVAQAYEIQPIPTTFILDPSGKIVNTLIGYHPPEVFEKEIEALLEKQKK